MCPRKILVVEDEPDIQDLICVFLRRRGHHVRCASSGTEGLSLLHAESPHLLLTDKRLPDCLGNELIRNARACGCNIKTVLMTGDTPKRGDDEGEPDMVLHKPFALHDLGRLVDHLLGAEPAQPLNCAGD